MNFEQQWELLPLEEDIRQIGTPLPVKEAKNDEWYIEGVVTSPDYRGQGIATQLFKHLITEDPNKKWSLNCDYDNKKALKLYKQLGFKWVEDINLYGHDYLHMIYKR